MDERFDCIIPAAGSSVRMGRWKPVLPFGDKTIIETVVAAALRACSRVVLITGYHGGDLASLFNGDPRVLSVQNEAWQQGMFSSIRLGVTQVRTRRFFITLGDMPWIQPQAYAALLEHEEMDVIFPAHGRMRGHPVLCSEHIRDAIAAADPESGSMRAIVGSFRVGEVAWPDDSILRDVDTEADLSREAGYC